MSWDTGPSIAISIIRKWADRLAHQAAHDALEKVHRILGDPDTVMTTARAWNKAGTLLSKSMNDYTETTARLFDSWEGTAHHNFKSYMEEVQKKTASNVTNMDAVATELLKSYEIVIATYSKAIDEIGNAASKLSGLDGDSGGSGGGKKAGWAAVADQASKILSSFAKGVSGWLSEGVIDVGKEASMMAEIQKNAERLAPPGSDPLT